METRINTQVKIYFIVMNGVYDNAEVGHIAVISTSREKLIEFYKSQVIDEPFRDEYGRYRSFKSGPLYDFNPLDSFDEPDAFGHGVKDEWVSIDELVGAKQRFYFVEE